MTRAKIVQKKVDITEVNTVYSDNEANKLLSEGWTLIHAGIAHIDDLGYNAKTQFIMGRTKEKELI